MPLNEFWGTMQVAGGGKCATNRKARIDVASQGAGRITSPRPHTDMVACSTRVEPIASRFRSERTSPAVTLMSPAPSLSAIGRPRRAIGSPAKHSLQRALGGGGDRTKRKSCAVVQLEQLQDIDRVELRANVVWLLCLFGSKSKTRRDAESEEKDGCGMQRARFRALEFEFRAGSAAVPRPLARQQTDDLCYRHSPI